MDAGDLSDTPLPPSPVTSPRRRPPWSALVLAVVLAVAASAVAAGALLIRVPALEREQASRESALAAARERTAQLTSYDHRRLDEDFAAVRETATGPFDEEYRTTTEELRPTFERTQAVAVGTVVAAGVEAFRTEDDEPERAVVVLAVDQVIRTAGAPERTERNRIRMTLVRPDGRWLVEQVQRL